MLKIVLVSAFLASSSAFPQNAIFGGSSSLFPFQFPVSSASSFLASGRVIGSVAQPSDFSGAGVFTTATQVVQPNVVVAQPRFRTVQVVTPAVKAVPAVATQQVVTPVKVLTPTVVTQPITVFQPVVAAAPPSVVTHQVVAQPQPAFTTVAAQPGPQIISQPFYSQPSVIGVIPQGTAGGCYGEPCPSSLNFGVVQSARLTQIQSSKPKRSTQEPTPRHIKSDREFSELDITY